MVKRRSLLSIMMISLAISLLLVGCNIGNKFGNNILAKMFVVTDDNISLNNIEFLMSKDEVIKNKKIDIDDLEVNTEEQIVKGISENTKEAYVFQNNKLIGTYTVMLIDRDKYSDACNQIYQQVVDFMPTTSYSDIEQIKEGKGSVMWICDDIQVFISFPDAVTGDGERTIVISAIPGL